MNAIRRALVEKWLKRHGWAVIDYPVKRNTVGYAYTVYSHPQESGVWDIEEAVERTKHHDGVKA